jgi:hypothetical protein
MLEDRTEGEKLVHVLHNIWQQWSRIQFAVAVTCQIVWYTTSLVWNESVTCNLLMWLYVISSFDYLSHTTLCDCMIEALVTSLWQCKHLLNGCDDVILFEGWEEKGKWVKTEREKESGTLPTSLIFVLMAAIQGDNKCVYETTWNLETFSSIQHVPNLRVGGRVDSSRTSYIMCAPEFQLRIFWFCPSSGIWS